jgi:hypothetical protein
MRELEMPTIELLYPTENGRPAKHPENKLRNLVVGQDEAIHQIVRAYQTHLAGLSPVGRPIGNFLFLGPTAPRNACTVVARSIESASHAGIINFIKSEK